MRYLKRSAAIALALTAVVAGAANASTRPDAAAVLSRTPVPEDPGWRQQILNAKGPYARPRSVTVEGPAAAVRNKDGLLAEGGRRTTLTTTKERSTRLVLDMGRLTSGYVELGVSRATGAKIRMSYAEGKQFLTKDGDADPDPDGFFHNGRTLSLDDDPDGRADVFASPRHPTVLRSAGLRGSQRFIAITLDGPGSVTIDFLRVRQTNFGGSYSGHFLSSDDVLNKAWYASAYGLDLSTIRDTRKNPDAQWVTVDGPKRDRIVYAGDIQVVALGAYYQGGEYRRVMRDTINLFACQQRPDGTFPAASVIDAPCKLGDPGPPDGSPRGFEPPGESGLARLDSFTAWWVIEVADYLRYSGDREFVRSLLPVARRAVQFFTDHSEANGLFRTADYDGAPAFNWHPPDKAVGVDGYSNVAYFGALQSLARLEKAVGDADRAPALERRAEQVKQAFNDVLWDPEAGAVLLNTEDPRRDHGADANAGALVFGLLDESRARQAMDFLKTKLGTPYGTATTESTGNPYMTRYVSPYIMAQETLGRFRYGDATNALDLIRTAWPHMAAKGAGLAWEEMSDQGTPVVPRPGTSLEWGGHVGLAHAWSTAVPALSRELLGVAPLADGYRRWEVSPVPGDVRWAQGDVSIPGGTITSRWERGDNGSFKLTVKAPRNREGEVAVPLLGKERTIAMDGRVVWRDGKPVGRTKAHRNGDSVVFTSVEGQHTFAWR